MQQVVSARDLLTKAPALLAAAMMLAPLFYLPLKSADPFQGTSEALIVGLTWLFALMVEFGIEFRGLPRAVNARFRWFVLGLAGCIGLSASLAPMSAASWAYAATFITYLVLGLSAVDWLGSGPFARVGWLLSGLAAMMAFETLIGSLQAAAVDFRGISSKLPEDSYFWNYFGVIGGVGYPNPIGTLGNPNYLGEFLALVMPVIAGWVTTLERAPARWVAGLCLLAPVTLLLGTGCRAAVLGIFCSGLVATPLVFGWQAFHPRAWFATRSRRVATGVFALAVCLGLLVAGGTLLQKFHGSTAHEADVTSRVIQWRVTTDIWREHPVFGAGLGSFRRMDLDKLQQEYPHGLPAVALLSHFQQAHNEPLQALAELGLVGFLLLAGGLVAWALETRRNETLPIALRFGLLWGVGALLIAGFFGFPLHIPITAMALTFILAIGLARPLDLTPAASGHSRHNVRVAAVFISIATLGAAVIWFDVAPLYRGLRAQYDGDYAMDGQEYKQAAESYQQAYADSRFKGEVAGGAILALAHLHRYHDVVSVYDSNAHEGMDIETMRLDGIALAQLGRPTEAIEKFTAFAQFFGPDHPRAKWAQDQITGLRKEIRGIR